jgi:hypothetical protein
LHLHQFLHRSHVVIQVPHDPQGTEHNQTNDQHSEGEREHVVFIVRVCGDVQEEDQMDAVMFENSKRRKQLDGGSFVEPQNASETGSTIDPLYFRTLNWRRCNQFIV